MVQRYIDINIFIIVKRKLKTIYKYVIFQVGSFLNESWWVSFVLIGVSMFDSSININKKRINKFVLIY